jgi:hypothetical protein
MRRVELTIRSPTATAWLLSAIGIICTGELYYEMQKSKVAQFFDRPFTDGELMPIVIVLGVLSACTLLWLMSLYCLPGKITLDPETQTLSRLKLKGFRQLEIKHPLKDWRAEITYFSQKDKDNKHFKKILLGTTTYAEIILFADLSRGEALVEALSDLHDQLGNYVITIETGG